MTLGEPVLRIGPHPVIFCYEPWTTPSGAVTETTPEPTIDDLPDPQWEVARDPRQEEVTFQATCKNTCLKELLEEVITLRHENTQLKIKNQRLTALIQKYAEPILKQVAINLLDLIRRSPPMLAKLEKLLGEAENVNMKGLIQSLDAQIGDEWVVVDEDNAHEVVNLDRQALKELSDDLALIGQVTNGNDNPTIKLQELQKLTATKTTKAIEAYNAVNEAWEVVKGLAFVGQIGMAIIPSIIPVLQLLFPASSILLVTFLIRVIQNS